VSDVSELEDFERIPCADGACIGTIGTDGCCRECGLEYDGPLPERLDDSTGDGDHRAPEDVRQDDHAFTPAPSEADDDDPWASRQLCPDGACIGVIGPDGRCGECGLEAD